MILHFIVPTNCRRDVNALVQSIYDAQPHEIEVRLHLMFQSDRRHMLKTCFDKANEALDMIDSGWVMFASDNDVIDPSLLARLTYLTKIHPQAECFVFSCQREDRILHARPENMVPCEVGGNQYCIKRDLIRGARFDYMNLADNADGAFIMKIYRRHPEKFIFVDEPLVSFDKSSWGSHVGSTAVAAS